MLPFTKKQFFIGLLIAIIVAAGLVIALSFKKPKGVSESAVRTRYACDRATKDVRPTDVFCTTGVYNNGGFTDAQFRTYLNCDKLTKDSANYETCNDTAKFKAALVKFNNYIVTLKNVT